MDKSLELNFIEANDAWYASYSQVGSIISSILSEEQMGRNYVLCDGRSCVGTLYSRMTGNVTVPDLRDRFLRGANGEGAGLYRGYTTSIADINAVLLPAGAHTHTGTATASGAHTHDYERLEDEIFFLFDETGLLGTGGDEQALTSENGAHSHALTLSLDGSHSHLFALGGGDSETAPSNCGLNFYIKVN